MTKDITIALEHKDRKIARLEARLDMQDRLLEITRGLHMPELEQYKYMQALDEVDRLTELVSKLELELKMYEWREGTAI